MKMIDISFMMFTLGMWMELSPVAFIVWMIACTSAFSLRTCMSMGTYVPWLILYLGFVGGFVVVTSFVVCSHSVRPSPQTFNGMWLMIPLLVVSYSMVEVMNFMSCDFSFLETSVGSLASEGVENFMSGMGTELIASAIIALVSLLFLTLYMIHSMTRVDSSENIGV